MEQRDSPVYADVEAEKSPPAAQPQYSAALTALSELQHHVSKLITPLKLPGEVNVEVAAVYRSFRTLQRALEKHEQAQGEVTAKRPRVDLSTASHGMFVPFRTLQRAAEAAPAKSSEAPTKKKKKANEDVFFEDDAEEEEEVEEEDGDEDGDDDDDDGVVQKKTVEQVLSDVRTFCFKLFRDSQMPFFRSV